MHPYLLHEIARQRGEDLRRATRRYGPAGPRRRPVIAARTVRPGGGPTRSKPRNPAARLLAVFRKA